MPIRPGSKYYPFHQYLNNQTSEQITLTFTAVERMLKEGLPPSARRRRGFWSNREQGGYQASAWLEAGYRVAELDLGEERIVFAKQRVEYKIGTHGESLAWDSAAVKGLRVHLGMSQREFAEELGVRQQTISEWETGQYQPTRSRSKHLRLVAERARFPYRAEEGA